MGKKNLQKSTSGHRYTGDEDIKDDSLVIKFEKIDTETFDWAQINLNVQKDNQMK